MTKKLVLLIFIINVSSCASVMESMFDLILFPNKPKKSFNDASLCNDMWDCPKGTFKDCKQTEENSRCDCRCEPLNKIN